jgi:hypothetical protein
MKRHLPPFIALSMKRVAFTVLCCALLALFVAPAWAADQCSGALGFPDASHLGSATGCGVLITVNPDGSATVTTPLNGNPYDGVEDTLVGIQNNSGGSFASITISGSSSPPLFELDGDGPCTINTSLPCGPTGYEGPNNTFTNISTDLETGTVTFTTPLANGTSTWFALEGAPSAVTVGAISQTQTLTFNPGTNVQQQATANCGSTNEVTGACTNPDASSVKIGFPTVMSQFQVKVTFTEVDGDGVCVIPASGNANDSTDFDCTFANFFGDSKPLYGSGPPFNAPFTFPPGTVVHTPYCLHYARNFTKCVDINVELLNGAAPGTNFSGDIQVYSAWNAPTSTLFPPLGGAWGSDPTVTPRYYDAPHNDSDTVDYSYPKPTGYPYSPTDTQKVFDVTGFFNPIGQAGVDGGIGLPIPGSKTPNHFAVAFPLAPPDTGELVFPLSQPDPACYIKGLPMPVLFEIEKANTEIFDPNALTAPNYARITVLQNTLPVAAPLLGQIIPVPFFQLYAAALSNANLTTSTSTSTTLYQLQIQSNLMAKPLTKNFVVKKSCR